MNAVDFNEIPQVICNPQGNIIYRNDKAMRTVRVNLLHMTAFRFLAEPERFRTFALRPKGKESFHLCRFHRFQYAVGEIIGSQFSKMIKFYLFTSEKQMQNSNLLCGDESMILHAVSLHAKEAHTMYDAAKENGDSALMERSFQILYQENLMLNTYSRLSLDGCVSKILLRPAQLIEEATNYLLPALRQIDCDLSMNADFSRDGTCMLEEDSFLLAFVGCVSSLSALSRDHKIKITLVKEGDSMKMSLETGSDCSDNVDGTCEFCRYFPTLTVRVLLCERIALYADYPFTCQVRDGEAIFTFLFPQVRDGDAFLKAGDPIQIEKALRDAADMFL